MNFKKKANKIREKKRKRKREREREKEKGKEKEKRIGKKGTRKARKIESKRN